MSTLNKREQRLADWARKYHDRFFIRYGHLLSPLSIPLFLVAIIIGDTSLAAALMGIATILNVMAYGAYMMQIIGKLSANLSRQYDK